MKITEVMHSPAVTCPISSTLAHVAELMRDRNVGSVLVLDQIGYLAGVVTDRDIVVRAVGERRSPDCTVETVMTRDVATVGVHADVFDAASMMARHQVRRLPVVDEHGHVHGVVTLDDLLRQQSTQTDRLVDTVLMQSRRFPIP